MSRVLVFGSLNLDLIIRVSTLPVCGETIIGTSLGQVSGGKGGNQAYVAARLSNPADNVVMVARVGNDEFGSRLTDDLRQVGVQTSMVTMFSGSSGVAIITVSDDGANTIVVSPGVNNSWDEQSALEVLDNLSGADILVVQLEVPVVAVIAGIHAAKQNGAKVILNAAPVDPVILSVLAFVDVLVVNEVEAEQLFGATSFIELQSRAAALGFIGDLVVTLGGDGVTLVDRRGRQRSINAIKVDVVDTVGAGDAFVGALAAALASGADLISAAEIGNAAGAFTATYAGARHPDISAEIVQKMIRKSKLNKEHG